jgi:Aspartyl protease
MRGLFCTFLFLFGTVVATSPSRADECKPLQLLTSIQMDMFADNALPSIPVSINGVSENMMVSSAAPIPTIDSAAASSLGLVSSPSRVTLVANAERYDREYRVETFDFGSQRIKGIALQENPGAMSSGGPIGLFPLMMLHNYDVDLDFGAKRLNLFSQDHCASRVTYWPERPLAVVPFKTVSGNIYISVLLDGHPLNAVIDTGSAETIMSSVPATFTMHLSLGAADTPQIAFVPRNQRAGLVVSSSDTKIYSHTFDNLSFDGVTIANLKVKIYSDSVVHERLPQVTIGMNVLRHLHIYIAYRENKLYITPAGSGESALVKKKAPSP